jgi:uncharacterized protein YbjT (DUF2867 family)
LSEKGATVIATDLGDVATLTAAFKDASVVYLMIPPIWNTTNWRASMRAQAQAYEQAVRESGIKKIVLLSSQGAHRTEGNGPVGGLGEFENMLKAIPGIDVLALRPCYFMENLFSSVPMIQHAGINGGVQKGDMRFPLVHTRDIAEVATKALLNLDFSGYSHQFIVGPSEYNFREITTLIGKTIGKPELPYVEFTPADGKAGMMQAGLPETIADGYVEMAGAMNEGVFFEGYQHSPEIATPTSLEWFVENELKHAFEQA